MKKDTVKKNTAKKSVTAAKPEAKKAPAPKVTREARPVAPKKTEPEKTGDKTGPIQVKPAAKPLKSVQGGTNGKGGETRERDEKIKSLRVKKDIKPFTIEEAIDIASAAGKSENGRAPSASVEKTPVAPAKPDLNKLAKAQAPTHIKAASLADILGFNPKKAQKAKLFADPESIPEKYRRYYKLLLDLRRSLTDGLALHTEETLRRSTKDDAGDLSSYGQHMADAGTDTFDRDFALSMVANEQEALTEIDAAIKRIENGTYGVCEITQRPIAKERLAAVPFTRYSAEAQKDIERNRMRVRTAAGLFGEIGEDAGRTDEPGGGDEE